MNGNVFFGQRKTISSVFLTNHKPRIRMQPTSLPDVYLCLAHARFNVSAPLSPFEPCMRLGDYGPYHQGTIDWQGNLFSDLGLDPQNFILRDPYVDTQILIASPSAHEVSREYGVTTSGELYADINLRFMDESGFLLHFGDIHSELFLPDIMIDHYMQQLVDQGKWRSDYRMVWQRTLAKQTSMGYTTSRGGKLTLRVEGEMFFHHIQDVDALPCIISHSQQMELDTWFRPTASTPAVNLLRLRDQQELEKEEGFGDDELSGFSANTLVLDNRPSRK